jgi:hypothetical protein
VKLPRTWSEKSVKLAEAEVVVFRGPGPDYTIVIHGKLQPKPPRLAKRARRTARRVVTPTTG